MQTNENLIEDVMENDEIILTGRGGIANFPSSVKTLIQTEAQREVARKLLSETLTAYRKPKVHSDEELTERLDEYFEYCASNAIIPTVEEMALYTGYAPSSVWNWEKGRTQGPGPQSSEIIRKAKDFMQTFDAKLVTSGTLNFLTYCFRAKNYYGMTDKQEHVLIPAVQETPADALLVEAEQLPE